MHDEAKRQGNETNTTLTSTKLNLYTPLTKNDRLLQAIRAQTMTDVQYAGKLAQKNGTCASNGVVEVRGGSRRGYAACS